jgi:Anti-sigma-K factor rskA
VTSDDDRIAYLAGDAGAPVDPDDRVDLDGLRDLLADPAMWAEPDPSLEDRIVAAISSEASKAAPVSLSRPSVAKKGEQRRRRRLYGALGAVAAIAVLIVITVGLATRGSNSQRYTAALSPTGLGQGASGAVTLTRTTSGWRIELRASGLPRLDNGRYYEAWMKNGAGVFVPIGTFNQGPEVTLWSGVSPKDFPTITVTREQDNGVSSGQRVLSGSVTP